MVVMDELPGISICLIQHRLAHQLAIGSSLLFQEGHVLDSLVLVVHCYSKCRGLEILRKTVTKTTTTMTDVRTNYFPCYCRISYDIIATCESTYKNSNCYDSERVYYYLIHMACHVVTVAKTRRLCNTKLHYIIH